MAIECDTAVETPIRNKITGIESCLYEIEHLLVFPETLEKVVASNPVETYSILIDVDTRLERIQARIVKIKEALKII